MNLLSKNCRRYTADSVSISTFCRRHRRLYRFGRRLACRVEFGSTSLACRRSSPEQSVFPYIGKVSQVVPGTASQACRRHMETRLKLNVHTIYACIIYINYLQTFIHYKIHTITSVPLMVIEEQDIP